MDEGARRSSRPRPWSRIRSWLFDGVLAVAAASLSTSLFGSELSGGGLPRTAAALGYALVLLHTLPLAVPPVLLGPAVLVPVYTVAAYCERRASLAGLAVAEAALAGVQLTPGHTDPQTWVGDTLVLAAAWLLGRFVGDRRVYAWRLEERTAELEQAREELARRAVVEERLRIARELHDVVAHAISVIAVQAGVGAHVATLQPEEAHKALAAVEATSRTALNELRRLLGVLREDDQGGEPRGSLAPVPGLAGLDTLVARVGEAGLAVRLRVEGTRPEVPPGVDLSAYRIVQEALTNVLKHAGPARAQVLVCYGDREVTVEVSDDGRGAAGGTAGGTAAGRTGAGHGLVGVRERVALFGGDLEVGSRPGGGFRVSARLPFEGGPQ